MSLKSELNKINFMINSGINVFTQNLPNPLYQTKEKYKKTDKKNNNILLSEVNNLAELREYFLYFNGCKLKDSCKQTVFSDGNPNSKIMLVGEAPGADEDKYGKPFVGLAGKLLDKMLNSINLDRNKVYISNVIPWRPPNNRQPTTEEILQCLPLVQKHIELIDPYLLILLGGTAAKSLLTTNQGITNLRGKWHQYNTLGLPNTIMARAIFHPAFLLRSPAFKKETWEDLLEIKKNIKNENI
tara:strand:- start:187 stop:912 length:726 start_codon:yes stop_codon:yes gene_type:complete